MFEVVGVDGGDVGGEGGVDGVVVFGVEVGVEGGVVVGVVGGLEAGLVVFEGYQLLGLGVTGEGVLLLLLLFVTV